MLKLNEKPYNVKWCGNEGWAVHFTPYYEDHMRGSFSIKWYLKKEKFFTTHYYLVRNIVVAVELPKSYEAEDDCNFETEVAFEPNILLNQIYESINDIKKSIVKSDVMQ